MAKPYAIEVFVPCASSWRMRLARGCAMVAMVFLSWSVKLMASAGIRAAWRLEFDVGTDETIAVEIKTTPGPREK